MFCMYFRFIQMNTNFYKCEKRMYKSIKETFSIGEANYNDNLFI